MSLTIASAEHIQGNGEEFIVDPAWVEWEYSHQ